MGNEVDLSVVIPVYDEEESLPLLWSEIRQVLLFGSEAGGAKVPKQLKWGGIVKDVAQRFAETTSDAVRGQLEEYMSTLPCTECGGARLRPESLAVTVHDLSIGDVTELSIDDALEFFAAVGQDLTVSRDIAAPILKEVRERLQFLVNVGLEYLTLGRSLATLSSAETRQLDAASAALSAGSSLLASQLGARIGLDDVGLGQSNFRMMLDCRPDYFKVDRCLVLGCAKDPYRQAVLESIHGLARKFGGRVVAEGVEDPDDLLAVKATGIDLVQGHLFAPAQPLADLIRAGFVPDPGRVPRAAASSG